MKCPLFQSPPSPAGSWPCWDHSAPISGCYTTAVNTCVPTGFQWLTLLVDSDHSPLSQFYKLHFKWLQFAKSSNFWNRLQSSMTLWSLNKGPKNQLTDTWTSHRTGDILKPFETVCHCIATVGLKLKRSSCLWKSKVCASVNVLVWWFERERCPQAHITECSHQGVELFERLQYDHIE